MKRFSSLIGLAASAWVTAAPSWAVSFDCRRASTDVEFMICRNPTLSNLDDRLAAAYSSARMQSSNPNMVTMDQRTWLARRNACPSPACVAREYEARLAELSGNAPRPATYGMEVQLRASGGTLMVPVSINNAITLNFTIDSGAADVAIPADVVLTLIRTGTITEDDFLGDRTYTLADGSTVPSKIFRIRSLRVGTRTLEEVTASVSSVKGDLLLGQSFLSRFRSWSINNQRGVLILE